MTRGNGQDRDRAESFISVDVETAGSSPATYSMLSLGACLVDDPVESTFYVEVKPEKPAFTAEALEVTHLSLDVLEVMGETPADAMAAFAAWIEETVPAGHRPVFVGFNAAFDWMFVSDYFERHLGLNPFGHSALDIKAFAMGRLGGSWAETSMDVLGARYLSGRPLSHHALSDAQDQAELFRALRAEPTHPVKGPPDDRAAGDPERVD